MPVAVGEEFISNRALQTLRACHLQSTMPGYNQGLTVSADKLHKAALNRSTSLPVQFGEEAGPALHGRSAAGNKQLQRPRSSGGLGLNARASAPEADLSAATDIDLHSPGSAPSAAADIGLHVSAAVVTQRHRPQSARARLQTAVLQPQAEPNCQRRTAPAAATSTPAPAAGSSASAAMDSAAGSSPSSSHVGSPPAAAGSKTSAAKAGSKARDSVPSYMMGTGHLRGDATSRVKLHFRGGNAGSSEQSSPLPGAPRRLVRSSSGGEAAAGGRTHQAAAASGQSQGGGETGKLGRRAAEQAAAGAREGLIPAKRVLEGAGSAAAQRPGTPVLGGKQRESRSRPEVQAASVPPSVLAVTRSLAAAEHQPAQSTPQPSPASLNRSLLQLAGNTQPTAAPASELQSTLLAALPAALPNGEEPGRPAQGMKQAGSRQRVKQSAAHTTPALQHSTDKTDSSETVPKLQLQAATHTAQVQLDSRAATQVPEGNAWAELQWECSNLATMFGITSSWLEEQLQDERLVDHMYRETCMTS